MCYLSPVKILQLLLRPSDYLFKCGVDHREISEPVPCCYADRYPLKDVVKQYLALFELFPDIPDAEIFQNYDVSGKHKYEVSPPDYN